MSEAGRRRKESRSTATMLGMAARIKSLRFRLDRSQAQFAALVGVPSRTVEVWELGEGIGRNDLVLIADRTGASLHWLISGMSPSQIEAFRAEAVRSLDFIRAAKCGEPDAPGRKSDERGPEQSRSERSALWRDQSQGAR